MKETARKPGAMAQQSGDGAPDPVDRALSGDTVALARLLTRAERGDAEFGASHRRLWPRIGRAWRVGVTGSPGAGKSTLVESYALKRRAQGDKVAVIAVDPTSPFTGGALLGDRVRMNRLALDPGCFVRSMASRGSMGGLARTTDEVADVLDAAGFERVVIETVGVGQSEVDVVRSVDTVIVVLVPGAGDGVQALKAGLMEIADVFVVNKADRPGVERVIAELEEVIALRSGEAPPPAIVQTVAVNGEGIDALDAAIEAHRAAASASGAASARRAEQRLAKVRRIVEDRLASELFDGKGIAARAAEAMSSDAGATRSPYQVADELLAEALAKNDPRGDAGRTHGGAK